MTKPENQEHIPAWLYSPINRVVKPPMKWTEEKQEIAESIMESMRNHARWWYWRPAVWHTLFDRYKEDNPHWYGSETGHNKTLSM